MPSVWKKESKILHAIARKKMKDFANSTIVQQAQTEIQQIKPWQPKAFESPEAMETAITEYIQKQEQTGKPLTITGLALALWIDRQTLLNYSKKEPYFAIINKYRQVLLEQVEQALTDKSKFTPGQIFYLKNNYKNDYSDKVEVEHTWNISLVELNRRAMQLQDCEIIDWEEVEKAISPQEEAQAEA